MIHDGGGDSEGLANMVRYATKTYNADPKRVFVTGSSSGCAMTTIMCAAYPDLIAAGSCYSGAAAGCLAGSEGFSPLTADPACGSGEVRKTGQEWASIARAMYPGYTGAYPRMQTWHGTTDSIANYANLAEEIKQWTTLLNVTFTRNETDTPEKGYTQMRFGDGTQFMAYSVEGVGHTVPVHESDDLKWFGLA